VHRFGGVMAVGVLLALAAPALASEPASSSSAQGSNVAHHATARSRARANSVSATAEREIAPRPTATTGVESSSPAGQVASGVDLTPFFIVLLVLTAIGVAVAALRRELPED
jgi:hypothetical protein